MSYIVQFDKTFLDGPLAGMTATGQCITFPTRASADRARAVYSNAEQSDDFMREAVTGARFKVSNVALFLSDTDYDPMGAHNGWNQ